MLLYIIQIVSIIFIGVKSMFDNVQINIPGGLDFEVPKMVKVKQNFENHKTSPQLFGSSKFQNNKNPSNRREAPPKILGYFWH